MFRTSSGRLRARRRTSRRDPAAARAVALVYKRREHVVNLFIAENRDASTSEAACRATGYDLISWTGRSLAYLAVFGSQCAGIE